MPGLGSQGKHQRRLAFEMGLKGQVKYSMGRSEEGIPGREKHRNRDICVKLQNVQGEKRSTSFDQASFRQIYKRLIY